MDKRQLQFEFCILQHLYQCLTFCTIGSSVLMAWYYVYVCSDEQLLDVLAIVGVEHPRQTLRYHQQIRL